MCRAQIMEPPSFSKSPKACGKDGGAIIEWTADLWQARRTASPAIANQQSTSDSGAGGWLRPFRWLADRWGLRRAKPAVQRGLPLGGPGGLFHHSRQPVKPSSTSSWLCGHLVVCSHRTTKFVNSADGPCSPPRRLASFPAGAPGRRAGRRLPSRRLSRTRFGPGSPARGLALARPGGPRRSPGSRHWLPRTGSRLWGRRAVLARRPQSALLVAQVARWRAEPLQLFFAGNPPDTVRSVISVDEDSARLCHAVSLLAYTVAAALLT